MKTQLFSTLFSSRATLPVTAAVCALTAFVVSGAPSVEPPNPPPPPPNQDGHHPAPLRPGPPPQATGRFGDPLSGLTATQLANFTTGLAQFETVDGIEDGLGPIFNNDSCAACHTDAATGGGSILTVTRFGRTTNGVFDPLTSLDGSLLHAKAINPKCQEVIPAEANTTALSEKPVPLYSDLLLHDMGDLNDGIAQAAAGANQMKTAPLWGLRVRTAFLHDGSATTIDEAIRAHDGEALRARNRYVHRSKAQQQQLIDFLNSI